MNKRYDINLVSIMFQIMNTDFDCKLFIRNLSFLITNNQRFFFLVKNVNADDIEDEFSAFSSILKSISNKVSSKELPLEGFNITKHDKFYSRFFAYKISTLDSYEIKDFLEHLLVNSFNDDFNDFREFLKATISDNKNLIFKDSDADLINDWINKTVPNDNGVDAPNDDYFYIRRNKIKRDSHSQLTILTNAQTQLLFYLLYKQNIFLEFDNDLLKQEDFYRVIEVLTGFKENQVRKEFSVAKNGKMPKEEYKRVRLVLNDIIQKINQSLA